MYFWNQYITGKVLPCSASLRASFLQYLMLVLKISSLDFYICKYVNNDFLFLFEETSANSLEM